MNEPNFAVDLTLRDGYQFLVDFGLDGVPDLVVDEPPPTGEGAGPGPPRLLAAAVANCLSASLLFCLRRARIEVAGLRTRVEGDLVRTESGRLRVGELRVRLEPEVEPADMARIGRCLEVFEDFCIVGQSVRAGIAIGVEVAPATPAGEATRASAAPGTELAERGTVGKRITNARPSTSGA